jgi:molecular chaperone DnaK (HSP70)
MAENNLLLDSSSWDSERWMQLRAAAQRVKEGLSTHAVLPFPFSIREQRTGRRLTVRFSRTDLEHVIAEWTPVSIDLVPALLDQAGLTLGDVDTMLLVGGSTRIPSIQALAEKAFGKAPLATEPLVLAKGAALYAVRLEALPTAAKLDADRGKDSSEATASPVEPVVVRATLEATEGAGAEAVDSESALLAITPRHARDAPEPRTLLDYAARLVQAGQTETARVFLQGVIRDAESLLRSIPTESVPPKPRVRVSSRRAIARAQQLIAEGRFEAAIRESHLAWQDSADSPEIFEEMVKIHCQAAMASTSVETYEDATRWLLCAYQHDQSNTDVRRLLAERHFLQARQLADRGRRREALHCVEQCLTLDPEHVAGQDLRESLSRR